jgi:hypothetical protein
MVLEDIMSSDAAIWLALVIAFIGGLAIGAYLGYQYRGGKP